MSTIRFLIALFFIGFSTVDARTQQQPQPTADQITIQLLEQEVKNYRNTISQLAVQLNAVTKERDELKAKQLQEPAK